MNFAHSAAVPAATPVYSLAPVSISAPGRSIDIELRVSAPVSGEKLPVILFAHGFGSSMDGYAPLVHYWASHGFVVLQPTFLDSRRLGIAQTDPRWDSIWKVRVQDMKRVLDELATVESSIPWLKGRVDHDRIAAVGHSWGGHTTSLLLGARRVLPDGTLDEVMSDPRIKAGVLLASAGRGGDSLSDFANEHLPYLDLNFDGLTIPSLVVAGDKDNSPLTTRGWEWFTDPYTLSPGANQLLTLVGGEHLLGGISGELVTETSDEDPNRVAIVQRISWAYLTSFLSGDEIPWQLAKKDLLENEPDHAMILSKKDSL